MLQLVTAFFQTVGYLPAVYGLDLPDYYYEWLGFFSFFEIDWSGFAIPGACLEGGFRSRLWLRGIGPLTLVAGLCLAGWLWRIGAHVIQRAEGRPPWISSLLTALPMVLIIVFVLVAGTSSSIFAVWNCEEFDFDSAAASKVAYLRADISLRCDSSDEEYSQVESLAFAFVALWPVG
eukprot:1750685-Prymnesium_polylepis.1